MTTDKPTDGQLRLGLDKTNYGIKVKSRKLLVGPFELGLSACYTLLDPLEEDAKKPLISSERFKPSLSVKDVYLRGKFELEPGNRCLHYSKKVRLPFLNTELFNLRLTAQLPAPEASGGILGRGLNLMMTFTPKRSHVTSVVRDAPNYWLQLSSRVGPPQKFYDNIGFPGSVYWKARATLFVRDSASLNGVSASLNVHSLNAVIRLYDSAAVKPCLIGRNLISVARQLTLEEVDEMEPVMEVSRAAEPLQPQLEPDLIDRIAAKSREWAHAVLVNSCVATRNLQDKAAQAAQQIRSHVFSVIPDGSIGAATDTKN